MVAADNLSRAFIPGGGGQYKVVNIASASSFDSELKAAEANGSVNPATLAGGADAVSGGVRVSGISSIPQPGGGERVAALLGTAEMMQSKSMLELNARVAGMLKSMALSSLEIGRGA